MTIVDSTNFRVLKTNGLFVLAIMLVLQLEASGQNVVVNRTLKESVITERAQNQRVVRNVTEELSQDGSITLRTNTFTELANGIHYWKDGQWLETKEQFRLFEGGAVAEEGPHQVILSANINAGGSVDLYSPDGKRLRSNPMGLSFREVVTGKTVLVAEVKDCIGEQVAPNVIIYPDAFTDFKGALRYTYTATGFEQDVIIYDEGFGRPENYGLDPATTLLEMWTEFFDPPAPVKNAREVGRGLVDEALDFGETQIGDGRAFSLDKTSDSVSVVKTWTRVEGREFLVESVPYSDNPWSIE